VTRRPGFTPFKRPATTAEEATSSSSAAEGDLMDDKADRDDEKASLSGVSHDGDPTTASVESGEGGGVMELSYEVVEDEHGGMRLVPRGGGLANESMVVSEGGDDQEDHWDDYDGGGGGAMTEDEWAQFLRKNGLDVGEEGAIIETPSFSSLNGEKSRGTGSRKNARKQTTKFKFVDRVSICVSGGQGGKGCISFEAMGPGRKRPSGGNGGAGGDVYIVADSRVQGLDGEKHQYKGKSCMEDEQQADIPPPPIPSPSAPHLP